MAVALINEAGLKFLLDKTPAECHRHFLIGVEPRSIQGIFVMLLVGAAMLSARQWICFCAAVFALVMVAALTTNVFSLFVRSEDLPWTWTYRFIPLGFTVSTGVASTALFLLPYRLRGWRIRRRKT